MLLPYSAQNNKSLRLYHAEFTYKLEICATKMTHCYRRKTFISQRSRGESFEVFNKAPRPPDGQWNITTSTSKILAVLPLPVQWIKVLHELRSPWAFMPHQPSSYAGKSKHFDNDPKKILDKLNP